MSDTTFLPLIEPAPRPSVADLVFHSLQKRILSLDLPPGAKLSEVDVAGQMGVSRQPVRDAFFRLSRLGFLVIRPQRSTTVSLISETAVMRAHFIRAALEAETIRIAADRLSLKDFADLQGLLDAQDAALRAGDKGRFHQLDDQFHRTICLRAGVGFAWDVIQESKAHMDRVRMLSLNFASRQAYEDHVGILGPLQQRDAVGAMGAMSLHLGRIRDLVDRIRAENHDWFESEETA